MYLNRRVPPQSSSFCGTRSVRYPYFGCLFWSHSQHLVLAFYCLSSDTLSIICAASPTISLIKLAAYHHHDWIALANCLHHHHRRRRRSQPPQALQQHSSRLIPPCLLSLPHCISQLIITDHSGDTAHAPAGRHLISGDTPPAGINCRQPTLSTCAALHRCVRANIRKCHTYLPTLIFMLDFFVIPFCSTTS